MIRPIGVTVISIHFLYTEEDARIDSRKIDALIFQSTSSIQRKTGFWRSTAASWSFQSTSSIQRKTIAGEEGPELITFQSASSIQRKTTLSTGGTVSILFQSTSSIQRKTLVPPEFPAAHKHFNPLPLYRGRPMGYALCTETEGISIHFLYTEEDSVDDKIMLMALHFNPLPLYRGRLISFGCFYTPYGISIHFLYTEEDEYIRHDINL